MSFALWDGAGVISPGSDTSEFARSWRITARLLAPLLPAAAILLIVALLGVLLWYVDRDERQEQRVALIKDTLWVEQVLRFHLMTIEENVRQLATDLRNPITDAKLFDVRSPHFMLSTPSVVRMALRSANGLTVESLPPKELGAFVSDMEELKAADDARLTGKPAYSQIYTSADAGKVFTLGVPLFDNGVFRGSITTTVSLAQLLSDQMPWWIAQRHRITFVDDSGNVLASKSDVGTDDLGPEYKLALNPPGGGLYVSVAPYRTKTALVHNGLVVTILVLAALACLGLYGMHRHMRRRVRAETALRSEHAFRKAMEDSLTVGVRARDLSGRIIYVNPAFCQMVGWSAVELIGREPPMPFWNAGDVEQTFVAHQAALGNRSPPIGLEIKLQRRSGERFDALIYEAPLIDAEGRHCGFMGSVLDVTYRKRAEELSRFQAEKLSRRSRLITVGEMASTLAHELNQPLSAITSYATGCLNKMVARDFDKADIATALEKLTIQAKRAGGIIARVHDLARKREPIFSPVDMTNLLHEVEELGAATAQEHGITLVVKPDNELPPVQADRILLEQVLLNLMRNGLESMANVTGETRKLTIASRRAGDTAEVSVADRGPGISEEIGELLFTPFVSTKPDGMGMGLNICRSIIELHKGSLWFETRPEGGVAFIFTIPLA
jgi:two-component system, LuxR family, sensor histidine kinase DctS